MPEPTDTARGPRDVPSRAARRAQAAIDSGAALALAMLAWPFPLARATLTPAVHVAAIFVFWQAVQVAYCSLAMSFWGATAGTRLMGLRVVSAGGAAPSRAQRALWGALCGATALVRVAFPARAGRGDVPERVAQVVVVAAEPAAH